MSTLNIAPIALAFALLSLGCEEPTARETCGEPPSQCIWGAPPPNYSSGACGTTQCGDWYSCECDRERGAWSVIALDCFCPEPPRPEPCDLVEQTGCAVGEKCAQRGAQSEPLTVRRGCTPDGDATEGAECTGAFDHPSGFDNCAAGLHCFEGVCRRICSATPDTCRTGDSPLGDSAYCSSDDNIFRSPLGLCETGT